MSDNIPLDIQMQIVKRVPVKSLFRFRSVSKSWKSMIDSSQFIADYNACESRPQRLLIGYRESYGLDPSYVCIVDDDDFPQHKFPTTVPMANYDKQPKELILVGSSQGLFCFLGESPDDDFYWEKAFIWNPAIGKSIAIDLPVFRDQMYESVLAFGVCPKTNDPILLRIDNGFEVDVFTLSSGVWRRLVMNLSCVFTRSHVAIDGFIYWQPFNHELLGSFDMTSEEFAEINLPCKGYWSVFKLNESLAVLEHYEDQEEKAVFAIWVMEHGVPKSFTKLFTVTTLNAGLTDELGFRENGELIFAEKTFDRFELPSTYYLKVYDPRSKHIKDLGFHGKVGSFSVSSYKETLLLLDQADNQIIKMQSSHDYHRSCFSLANYID